jgi:hypothetical protein
LPQTQALDQLGLLSPVELRIRFICSVKQANKKIPKDSISSILKDAPEGKWAFVYL